MAKRVLSVFFACLLLLVLPILPAHAAQGEGPAVAELNVEIGGDIYRKLTTEPGEDPYSVRISCADIADLEVEMNLRGSSSKTIGQMMKAKRIPFELTLPKEGDADLGVGNRSVKYINSFTLYRLVAEYLALDLFESFGIPTPAHEICFVRFNGEDLGLYLAVEDVNKTFLGKHYPEPLQTAYKATNKENKEGAIDSKWFGTVFPKAKKDPQPLLTLIDALERGDGFEELIDADEWLRYFACVAAIGGDGSIFSELNNFVLYDHDGRMELIPWDQSEAFSGRETPNGIDRYYVDDDPDDPNPLFDLIMREPENRERYHAYIRELCDTFLQPEQLERRYAAIVDAIAPYLPRDHSIGLNSENAEQALRSDSPEGLLNLRYALKAHRENLLAQLEGKERAFFVNEAYRELLGLGDFEETVAFLEKNSPLYDPKLPKKISAGHASYDGANRTAIFVVAGVIAVGAAGALVWLFTVRRVKKKKDH